MHQSTPRARLALTRLDDRTVPSTVTATQTARPFEFVGTGTLTTTDHTTDAGTEVTNTSTNTVTLTGTIDYESNTTGESGTVALTGTGSGSETPTATGTGTGKETLTPTGTTAGVGNYAQTLQGELSFKDDNGSVVTVDPLTGTASWFTPGGESGTTSIGPQAATGTFDASTFKLEAGWDTTGDGGTSVGEITVTLANKTTQATDLKFQEKAVTKESDGTVSLDFSVGVTGKVLTASSRTTAVARVTAEWAGDGQTQSVDLDVPVYWNTGQVTVSAAGLTPPAWATTLTVKLDAGQKVAEGDETNNTWSVVLADLVPPPEAPPPPPPGSGGPTPTPTPTPTPPSPPERRTPVGFTVTSGPSPVIQWRDGAGKVIGSTPAFDNYNGPFGIAAGDMTGDGVLDVAVGAGAGGGPRVRVLDGSTGQELTNFFAYDPEFRGGSNVAVADVDGDGVAELIAGAGDGGGPHVKVYNGETGRLVAQFFAFDPEFRGGVRVTALDLDDDGTDEVVVGAGPGGGPWVKVLDGRNGRERYAVLAAAPELRDGVGVGTTPDPSGKLVVTADPGPSAALRKFRGQLRAGDPLLTELPRLDDLPGVIVD